MINQNSRLSSEKKTASFVAIRPCPSLPFLPPPVPCLAGTGDGGIGFGKMHEPAPMEGQMPSTIKPGQVAGTDHDELTVSKQQRSYEDLKVSIVLCGEYLSNLLYADDKSPKLDQLVASSLKASLEASLDIGTLMSISSKRKKDIIVTGILLPFLHLAAKCIQWLERTNMELKIVISQITCTPLPGYMPEKKPIQRYRHDLHTKSYKKLPAKTAAANSKLDSSAAANETQGISSFINVENLFS